MSRDLPFTISFTLPPGWALVSPDSCGQPDAAWVAVRNANADDPVATNIVISGLAAAHADVAALAAEYQARMAAKYPVTVLKQDILTTADSPPEAAQLLQVEFPVGPTTVVLKQIQIINVLPGVDGQDVAVLQLLMTCPADVFDQAGPEFGQFMATIEPGS